MNKNSKIIFFIVVFCILPFAFVFAQSTGGSAPTAAPSSGAATDTPTSDSANPSTGASVPPSQQQTSVGDAVAQPAQNSSGAVQNPPPVLSPAPKPPVVPVNHEPAPATQKPIVNTITNNTVPVISRTNTSYGEFYWILGILGAIIVGSAGFFGIKIIKKGNSQSNNQQQNKCDSIKSLIDQQKQQLQQMVQNWPQEKLQELGLEKSLEFLQSDERTEKIGEISEAMFEKCDKLQRNIAMLQKRYTLCNLSLEAPEEKSFEGIIIENSLADKKILENIDVIKKYAMGDWMLHHVSVNEKEIKTLGECLNDGPWYMYFWNKDKDEASVVYKSKKFSIQPSHKKSWSEAVSYGKKLGLSEDKLNFNIQN